jgi:hypothetical protein
MSQPNIERPFFEDVEALFSEFVEFYGGKVIEKLDENLVDRLNADYFFEKQNTIAELKTFKKNIFSEPEDIPRFQDLMSKWVLKKMITQKQLRQYIFQGKKLPQRCLDDLISVASRTVERAIQKANKQIEESKKTFKKPNANGILFLINDGNYFFSSEGFLHIISNIIDRKFRESSFDVILYTTVNQVTQKEGNDFDFNVWIPIYTKVDDKGETIVTDEFHKFINDLGEKFQIDFLNLKTGHKPLEHNKIEDLTEAIEELKTHKFISKKNNL